MGDMIDVREWDEAVRYVAEARDKGRMVSNFFPDEKRMRRWCQSGAFSYMERGETTFFMRHQETFSCLYFLSTSVDALTKDLSGFLENQSGHLVVDVLGRDAVREPLEAAFKMVGFTALTTLQRMSRRTPTEKYEHESGIAVANMDDAAAVHSLLVTNFIAEEEQLPSLEDVQDWIATRSILVAREEMDQDIKGFVIFDLSPAALYLRYWFVSCGSRGNGVGSKLMRSMFFAGMNTKRQYFWVKTDNENAIKRYRHYGFEFEPLKDTVLSATRFLCRVNEVTCEVMPRSRPAEGL